MKIKDVSKLTGLTEKTIRYYEERMLIIPAKDLVNGREFRSYSETDVLNLIIIANLRKLDFSIADIITIRDYPEAIPNILKEYRLKTSDEIWFKANVLQKAEQLDFETIKSIGDLAEYFKEVSVDRSLPISDIELEFYKIDGLTREELNKEVLNYEERQITKSKKKIRISKIFSIILFLFSQTLFIIMSGLIYKNTYYLKYIVPFQDNIEWRKMLIPLYILFQLGFIFAFVKAIKYITRLNEEGKILNTLKICSYSILVLIISIAVGTMIQVKSSQSLENLQTKAGEAVQKEWSQLYNLTHYVDQYLSDQDVYNDRNYLNLYVNQICYNFYNDSTYTKIRNLLTECYDPVFREFVNPDSHIDKSKLKKMLMELDSELMKICDDYISNKSRYELAELTLKDSVTANKFRQRISNFVNKYGNMANNIFGATIWMP